MRYDYMAGQASRLRTTCAARDYDDRLWIRLARTLSLHIVGSELISPIAHHLEGERPREPLVRLRNHSILS